MKKGVIIVGLVLTLLLVNNVFASDAIAAYRSTTGSGANYPKLKFWTASTSTWGSEVELTSSTGSPIREAVIKYSTVNSKAVLVTQSDDGGIYAYVCPNGADCSIATSWSSTNIGVVWPSAPATHSRRFDVEFTGGGDAILVYSISDTSASHDLAYKVLCSVCTSWSGIYYINDVSSSADLQYTWVALDRKPTAGSNELVMAAHSGSSGTGANEVNAWVWTGTSWANQMNIAPSATDTLGHEAVAVRYAADGSKAMVIAGDGTTGNIAYRTWAGSWSSAASFDPDSAEIDDAYWLTLKADPSSNDLMATIIAKDYVTGSLQELHTALWDGTTSTWTATSHDPEIDTYTTRGADFEWDPSSSTGLLVWGTEGDSNPTQVISYRKWTGSSWNAIQTATPYVARSYWVSLYRNPTASDATNILGLRGTYSGTAKQGSFKWDGSSLRNYGDGAMSSDMGSLRKAGSIAFKLA